MDRHGRWVEARDLLEGDVLQSKTAGELTIIGLSNQRQSTVVYNLEVEDGHNYTVHQRGILVHNKTPIGPKLFVWEFEYLLPQMQSVIWNTDEHFIKMIPEMKHPRYGVEGDIEHVVLHVEQYYSKMMASFVAGEDLDVVMFHSGTTQWDFADYQMPLDDYISGWRQRIPEDIWAWHCKNGNPDNPVQMVPISRQGIGVYCNKANLRKAGLDPEREYKEWDEFLDACQALRKAGITPITYGNPTTGLYILHLLWCSMLGDEVETLFEPGQANFRDPRIRKCVEYLLELKSRGCFDEEQLSFNYFTESRESFCQGEGGFFIGQLSYIANWKEFSDALGAENCAYFPNWNIPKSVVKDAQVVDLGDVGYSIVTESRYPDLAAEYIKMWAVGKGSENLLWAGVLPASATLDIAAVGGTYPAGLEVIEAVSDGPVVMPVSHYLPNHAVMLDIELYIKRLITTVEIDIDGFIDGMQSKLEEYL
jgi:ABC-type glycerol-3-phosphate transport system substrate-binding protein